MQQRNSTLLSYLVATTATNSSTTTAVPATTGTYYNNTSNVTPVASTYHYLPQQVPQPCTTFYNIYSFCSNQSYNLKEPQPLVFTGDALSFNDIGCNQTITLPIRNVVKVYLSMHKLQVQPTTEFLHTISRVTPEKMDVYGMITFGMFSSDMNYLHHWRMSMQILYDRMIIVKPNIMPQPVQQHQPAVDISVKDICRGEFSQNLNQQIKRVLFSLNKAFYSVPDHEKVEFVTSLLSDIRKITDPDLIYVSELVGKSLPKCQIGENARSSLSFFAKTQSQMSCELRTLLFRLLYCALMYTYARFDWMKCGNHSNPSSSDIVHHMSAELPVKEMFVNIFQDLQSSLLGKELSIIFFTTLEPCGSSTNGSSNFSVTTTQQTNTTNTTNSSSNSTKKSPIRPTPVYSTSNVSSTCETFNSPRTSKLWANGSKALSMSLVDLMSTNPGQTMTSRCINIYMKHIYDQLDADKRREFLILSSDLLTDIRKIKNSPPLVRELLDQYKIDSSVNLFERGYIILPVYLRGKHHLAVICNLPSIGNYLFFQSSDQSSMDDGDPTYSNTHNVTTGIPCVIVFTQYSDLNITGIVESIRLLLQLLWKSLLGISDDISDELSFTESGSPNNASSGHHQRPSSTPSTTNDSSTSVDVLHTPPNQPTNFTNSFSCNNVCNASEMFSSNRLFAFRPIVLTIKPQSSSMEPQPNLDSSSFIVHLTEMLLWCRLSQYTTVGLHDNLSNWFPVNEISSIRQTVRRTLLQICALDDNSDDWLPRITE